MIYSKKHKFIFVHIPKTAGSSMLSFFEEKGITINSFDEGKTFYWNHNHLTINRISNWTKIDLDLMFKFAFVRNPWDMICSRYYFSNVDNSPQSQQIRSYKTFEEFILKDTMYLRNHYISRPCDYMEIGGKNVMNFIGRYEYLNEDFEKICNNINFSYKKLSHTNFSNRKLKDYKSEYTSEMVDVVYKLYKKEIRLFNYSFE